MLNKTVFYHTGLTGTNKAQLGDSLRFEFFANYFAAMRRNSVAVEMSPKGHDPSTSETSLCTVQLQPGFIFYRIPKHFISNQCYHGNIGIPRWDTETCSVCFARFTCLMQQKQTSKLCSPWYAIKYNT